MTKIGNIKLSLLAVTGLLVLFIFLPFQPTLSAQGNSVDEPDAELSDCNGTDIRAGLDESDPNHCGILDYLVLFINVLSGIVGVVVVGSIIVSGIQYSSAGSDPQKISAAKDRIRNAIIALAFFIFMYALLNYLVPGGVIR
ncbi:MAG: hypothetical protein M3Q14_04780 [bacterium]|nr:hypothetical protein [bacterium]